MGDDWRYREAGDRLATLRETGERRKKWVGDGRRLFLHTKIILKEDLMCLFTQSLRFNHLRFYDWSKIGACSIELGGIYVCLVVICHLKKQIVLPECLNSGFKSRVFMTSVNLFSCFIAFAWHFYHDCFEFSSGLWVKIKIAWRERANAENIR